MKLQRSLGPRSPKALAWPDFRGLGQESWQFWRPRIESLKMRFDFRRFSRRGSFSPKSTCARPPSRPKPALPMLRGDGLDLSPSCHRVVAPGSYLTPLPANAGRCHSRYRRLRSLARPRKAYGHDDLRLPGQERFMAISF